jgi:HTH-type transcriptional regulator/antitoxin HigA
MTMQKKVLDFRDLPRDYDELVSRFPLRPIHDAVDLQNATEVLDAMALHHERFSVDQSDYFDVLSSLVADYESQHDPLTVPGSSPIIILRSLLAAHDMSASDLGRILQNRELGSKILRGERKLTVNHIKKLAQHFKLDPGIFVG